MLDSSASTPTTSALFAPQGARAAAYPRERRRATGAAAHATDPLGATATDRDLGQALIECHPDALAAAWRRYHPMVHRMFRRALGAGGDVDDIVQDVFLSLCRRAHALRDAEAIRPFVLGIARHTLHWERRQRTRRRRLASDYGLQAADALEVGSGPAASYATLKLNALLQRLTEQERASFVLRFGHGMTVTEVAEALRVSEPTAKRRLSRARECLSAWAASDPFLLGYLRGEKISSIGC